MKNLKENSQRVVNHGLVPRAAAGGALADGIVDQCGLPLAVGVVLPVVRLLRRRVRNLRLKSAKNYACYNTYNLQRFHYWSY